QLLDALADHFLKSGYDVRRLMRTIMTSRLYQLEARPTSANAGDRRFYSHYLVKRVGAESLLDAVDAVTGVPTKFEKLPQGPRANGGGAGCPEETAGRGGRRKELL